MGWRSWGWPWNWRWEVLLTLVAIAVAPWIVSWVRVPVTVDDRSPVGSAEGAHVEVPPIAVLEYTLFRYDPICQTRTGRRVPQHACVVQAVTPPFIQSIYCRVVSPLMTSVVASQIPAGAVRHWNVVDIPGVLTVEAVGTGKLRIHVQDVRHVRCDRVRQ